jgi:serine/threonine-protein kinase RsbW
LDLFLQLTPDPQAPAESRQRLEDALTGSFPPDIVFDAKLLASELVTNSFQHAGLTPRDRIEVRLEASQTGVRVSVRDPGPGFEQKLRSLGIERVSGLGLAMLTRLANRWGVVSGRYCEVWFELDVERSHSIRRRAWTRLPSST